MKTLPLPLLCPPRLRCISSAAVEVGFFTTMRRGKTTAKELAPLMLRLLTATSKRDRSKKLMPLIDPVEHDYTQITKDEATRRFAELRKQIKNL